MAKTEIVSTERLRAILAMTEAPATLNEIDDMAEELLERRAANSDGGVEPWTGKEETYATVVSKWPEWLHDAVDQATDASDTFDWSTEQVVAYAILMARSPAKALDGIAVTALEWVKPAGAPGSLLRAETVVGAYQVWTHAEAGTWFWSFVDGAASGSGSQQKCFDDAQADFDRRVLSALK